VKKHSSLEDCPCISVAEHTNRVTEVLALPALQAPNGPQTANGAQMQACCSTTGAVVIWTVIITLSVRVRRLGWVKFCHGGVA